MPYITYYITCYQFINHITIDGFKTRSFFLSLLASTQRCGSHGPAMMFDDSPAMSVFPEHPVTKNPGCLNIGTVFVAFGK